MGIGEEQGWVVPAVEQGHAQVLVELRQDDGDEVLVPGDGGHDVVEVRGDRCQGRLQSGRATEGGENGRGQLYGVEPLAADVTHDDANAVGRLGHFVEIAADERLLRRRHVAGSEPE